MWYVPFIVNIGIDVYPIEFQEGRCGNIGVANVCLQTVMVLKYLVKDYPLQTLYFGIANVVANGLVMLRFVLTPDADLQTWKITLLVRDILG